MIRQKFIQSLLAEGCSPTTAISYANIIGGFIRKGLDPLDVPEHLRHSSTSAVTALKRFKQFVLASDVPILHIPEQWAQATLEPPTLFGVVDDFQRYLLNRRVSMTTALQYIAYVNRISKALAENIPLDAALRKCKSGAGVAQTAWNHYQTFLNPPPPKPDFSKILDVLPELATAGWLEPLAAGATWQDIQTVHGMPALTKKGVSHCLLSDEPLRRLRAWGCPDAAGCLILPAHPRSWAVPKLEDLREAVKQARAAAGQSREHGSSGLPAFPSPPPTPDIGSTSPTRQKAKPAQMEAMSPEVTFDLSAWTAEAAATLRDLETE